MNFINFSYLFTTILPKLITASITSLVIGSLVGGVVGLLFGKLTHRTKETVSPAILGSALGIMLFAMLPILSEPSLRDGGGPYGGLVILMFLAVGGLPGSIIGAVVGSICGLKVPRRLKSRVLWIALATIYSLMIVAIHARTAPTPFQFVRTAPYEQSSLSLIGRITGYDDGLCCMAFTPDGQHLVIANSGDIRIWQVNSGKQARHLRGASRSQLTLQDSATALVVAPDGKTFVTAAPESLRVRDLETGDILQQFDGQYYAELTPDGKTLISLVKEADDIPRANIGIWDLEQGRQRYLIPSEILPYLADTPFDISPDGKMLVVAAVSHTNSIEVWQLETGKLLTAFGEKLGTRISTLIISPDSKTVITAENNELQVRSIDTGETVKVIPDVGEVKNLLFTPDGNTLISSGGSPMMSKDALSLWQVETGEKLQSWPNQQGKWVHEMALSPDGTLLATYGDREVKLWQMPSGTP